VRKAVRVALSPDDAFKRFTEQISEWWPLPDFSVGQEKSSHVVFGSAVGEQIVEHMTDGSTAIWGTIMEWEPGSRVVFTWHPGREPREETQVAVMFRPSEDGTEVELVHTGWNALGKEARETRNGYDGGWDVVIGRYAGGHPA
jgi:uncharacterized protein YndB with AHSA1/START domain